MHLTVGLALLLVTQDGAPVDSAVTDYMKAHGVVGASVCVVQNGKTVVSKGYGYQDREHQVAASPKTVYRLGSVSKVVTATSLMRLVQDGKLDLDRDVRNYVPEYPAKQWGFTTRNVLTHSSGIRHYTSDKPDSFLPHFNSVSESLVVFKDDPLLFEPGTKFSYSTHAFTLAARIAEVAGGKPFGELLQAVVFKPAGTKTLGLEDLKTPAVKDRSELYDRIVEKGPVLHSVRREDNSWKYGGGGMESSVLDLAKFGQAVMDGKVLKQATVSQMWTPVSLRDGSSQYGLGWAVSEQGFAEHGGAQQGCRAYLRIDPKTRTVMAILTNTSGHPIGDLASSVWTLYWKAQ